MYFHVNSRRISPFSSVLIISTSSDLGGGLWVEMSGMPPTSSQAHKGQSYMIAATDSVSPPVFLELRPRHYCSVTAGCLYVMVFARSLWICGHADQIYFCSLNPQFQKLTTGVDRLLNQQSGMEVPLSASVISSAHFLYMESTLKAFRSDPLYRTLSSVIIVARLRAGQPFDSRQ
jgi:hypothetical protein